MTEVIRGAKAVSHAIGVSPATLGRMIRKGQIAVRKGGTGGRTSPIMIERHEAERIRKGR
ncbi:hypothetical protein ABB55_27305 [Prosthecomicrobium hirschii]|uniref:Helix-turn-helix domain-containing protein n=1 Tax=Prosthecodimorpha hirschii TaxID=665126 RepID=A0A0P6VWF4_9HYPH|nr:hypothetical protein [Prosthecomicrobium hirschii]KPL55487.1 hypothetical protein ABB55_27305 [Prosthecomicrobium hirschii]